MALVKVVIESSDRANEYIPISLKLTFEEEHFHNIYTNLEQGNILMKT